MFFVPKDPLKDPVPAVTCLLLVAVISVSGIAIALKFILGAMS